MPGIQIVRVSSGEEAAKIILSSPDNCLITRPGTDLNQLFRVLEFMAADFDGTTIQGGSLWKKTDRRLPEHIRNEVKEQFARYHEEQETTSLDVPMNLFRHIRFAVEKYVEAGFAKSDLHEIAEELEIRPGFRRLHALMEKTCIVSVGFAETIQHLVEHRHLPCEVMGTMIAFDDNGCACGYKSNQIMVDTTKGHAVLEFMLRRTKSMHFRKLLVIGDTINDRAMMFPGAVNILLVDPTGKVLPNRGPGYINTMWDNLTCILYHDNFEPLVELIENARHT